MSTPILATKLYIPPPRPKLIARPHLFERLNEGLYKKLTLISAPAGFGKSTLVSAWIAGCSQAVAWLSLDETDSDPTRFLTYFVAALQRCPQDKAPASSDGIPARIGQSVLALLQSPQPPPLESLLTTLLNEIATLPDELVLVLDDYHLIDAKPVDDALLFLLEHLPPQLHLVIVTREDPPLPLARLRARGQLTEIRAGDLRFTEAEAAEFLNQAMDLDLTAEEVAALESRTEGWIAGLQLAAVSLQDYQSAAVSSRGQGEVATFIRSFTGSHRFVMDYLLEEVLHQQTEERQRFLLYTSILDRMCGPLCDALLDAPPATGETTLTMLEQRNLFIVPLDNERRWYRYHHLFAELLRQRLEHRLAATADSNDVDISSLHVRAGIWYEEQGLVLDAFHHATIANDIGRAERLIEGNGMPLHFRGAIRPVLTWLNTLPTEAFDAHPSLWLAHASTLLATGQVARTEEALAGAEKLLQTRAAAHALDATEEDLIGRIAAIRATVAAGCQQVRAIITESERALAYLHPDNLAFRTSTNWKLGYAYHLGGDYAAAKEAYQEAITRSQASGNTIFAIMSFIGLGDIYQIESQLPTAAEHYQTALKLYGDQPLPSACEAHSGLAQIYYEWHEFDTARHHAEEGVRLGRQWEKSDSPIHSEWSLARLHLASGNIAGAAAQLAKTRAFMEEHHFTRHLDEIVATQVMTFLAKQNLADAEALVANQPLPLSQARVLLAQGQPGAAVAMLESAQRELTAQRRMNKVLKAMALRAVALQQDGQPAQAAQLLGETLALAEPGGWISLFVEEGPPMAQLLTQLRPKVTAQATTADYITKVLTFFPPAAETRANHPTQPATALGQLLPEPLSDREIEVLGLIAAGHKNQEIADELVVSLNTVRYHTKNLYGKLGVNKRTQAVAKAQALGLL